MDMRLEPPIVPDLIGNRAFDNCCCTRKAREKEKDRCTKLGWRLGHARSRKNGSKFPPGIFVGGIRRGLRMMVPNFRLQNILARPVAIVLCARSVRGPCDAP